MATQALPHWTTLQKLSKQDRRFIILQTIKERKTSTFLAAFAIICMFSPLIFLAVFHIVLYTACERSVLKRLVENLDIYHPGLVDHQEIDNWDQLADSDNTFADTDSIVQGNYNGNPPERLSSASKI